jgi:hypothetical protein
MPSTYTTNGGIELPANGEQSGTWGETVNDNMAIIDRLTNGVGAISLSGTTHTLTTADGTLSDGQYNVLVLGGSPSGTNTITISPNDGEHVYIVKNASGQTATFTQGSGANVSVLNNTTKIIYADGAGAGAAVVDITGALDLGSLIIAGTSVTATAAELNYNDITTLGTVQASKTVTANASGDVLFPDGDKAIFGDSSDLQIYHTGTYSLIADTSGTGPLRVVTNTFQLNNAADTQNMIAADEGGAVTLYHNNAAKIATTATGIDVTGTVTAGAGTALLPSITTTGDLNTGMWFPAADTIAFSEGGVEALRINSSGNVGIGTSSPDGNLTVGDTSTSGDISIRIKGDASSRGFLMFGDAGGAQLGDIMYDHSDNHMRFRVNNSERMRIDSSGNVGIGTSSPVSNLDVTGSNSRIRWDLGNAYTYQGATNSAGSAFAAAYYDGSEHRWLIASSTKAMIDSSGNVGIGTSSPTGLLNVKSTYVSDATTQTRLEDTTGCSLDFGGNASGHKWINSRDTAAGTAVPMLFQTGGTERMRIDSSGNVGIGTSSPTALLDVRGGLAVGPAVGIAKIRRGIVNGSNGISIQGNITDTISDTNPGASIYVGGGPLTDTYEGNITLTAYGSTAGGTRNEIVFRNRSGVDTVAERMRITSSGNVGIGTSSPDNNKLVISGSSDVGMQITKSGVVSGSVKAVTTGLAFGVDLSSGNTERMRIDSSGNLLVGTTSDNPSGTGVYGAAIKADGSADFSLAAAGQVVLDLNRGDDGALIWFRSGNVTEGNVSVSGTTVSYNGGHLARWSQLADNTRDDTLLKGTVLTNLDQMASWLVDAVEATYYTEDDELPDGVSVGDEKTPAVAEHYQDNEQLNCMAISSVEGDPNVAGVFVNWDNSDDIYNDMNIAMTGDMIIRIAQGTTVARGDLLMSAGDGTAKPQGDDIVRSKTIAKVTSTHVTCTYDDGSYCVPCVLMAC